jgi:hypothetical protein
VEYCNQTWCAEKRDKRILKERQKRQNVNRCRLGLIELVHERTVRESASYRKLMTHFACDCIRAFNCIKNKKTNSHILKKNYPFDIFGH